MKSKKSESIRSQASDSLNDLSQQQGVILPLPENTVLAPPSLPALSPAPTEYYIGTESSRPASVASSRKSSVKHESSASSSRKSAFSSRRSKTA
jgi:hypothetical protein